MAGSPQQSGEKTLYEVSNVVYNKTANPNIDFIVLNEWWGTLETKGDKFIEYLVNKISCRMLVWNWHITHKIIVFSALKKILNFIFQTSSFQPGSSCVFVFFLFLSLLCLQKVPDVTHNALCLQVVVTRWPGSAAVQQRIHSPAPLVCLVILRSH